ncbi:MAG: thiol-disulfide isomerase [Methylophaga sp.]|nr:MAG: thiol-disulfide isomerase [Methylophaga sp.]
MNRLLIMLGLLISLQGFTLTANAVNGPYDPERDPFKDFDLAQIEAKKNDKFILIQVGGNWCSWCHKLERFFNQSSEIKALLNNNFVVVKVNVSEENYNEEFLDQLPEFVGYPFLVVTDANGEVLNSITSGYLEEGNGYSETKFREYFKAMKSIRKKSTSG